ncbi:MAG TPA: hypothetical protein VGC14_02670 [Rhizobium sp.]
MLIVPFLAIIVCAILFPNIVRFMLTLFMFGVLFVIASCIDHANAQPVPSRDDLTRFAGYFSGCARANVIQHRDELHKMEMMGMDVQAVLILSCHPVDNQYVYWCRAMGHDEKSCYGDLRFIAEDVLKQYGN